MFRFSTERAYRRLLAFYHEAERMQGWPDARLLQPHTAVSRWSPAQHIVHVTLVNRYVFTGLQRQARRRDTPGPGRTRLSTRLLLAVGRLPRGQGQAPARVVPPAGLDRAAYTEAVAQSRQALEAVESLLPSLLPGQGRSPHPLLGPLDAPQWLRFAAVHADHHLAIVRDIAKQASAPLPA